MTELNQTLAKSKKIKLNFKDSKYATGRRKRSIAKVWVKKGSGNIHVNGLKMNEYFKRPVHQIIVTRPLEISEVATNYDVKCSVKGGGLSGQAGAIILGNAKIGHGSFVGAGSIIREGVTVGANCIVGAGVTVRHDIKDGAVIAT